MLRKSQKSKRSNLNLPLEVLVLPPRDSFEEISSPSPNHFIYKVTGKKGLVSSQTIWVQKRQLLSQLEIYQWRSNTDFPISRTKYVSIQPNDPASSSTPLIIFNENCPLTLIDLSPMPLPHILYMLKESLFGFQRLCRKFGAFQINERMIAVNEKGLCRVWIHQNFALNTIDCFVQEATMIQSIKKIMEAHCQQCFQSKQLFLKLTSCTSFVGCLKQIDLFLDLAKLVIPNRIPFVSSLESSRQNTFNPFDPIIKQICSLSNQHFRHSIIPSHKKQNEIEESPKHEQNDIKRFKSEEKIRIANMKVSDGETSYTRNNKDTKCSATALFSSPRQTSYDKQSFFNSNKKASKWFEECSFLLDNDQDRLVRQRKQKKELSHSEAVIKGKQIHSKLNFNSRKLSSDSAFYRFNSPFPIRSQHQAFTAEVNLILDDQQKKSMRASSRINEEEQEDNRYREEHTGIIMKNNGWNNFGGLLKGQENLNESFHEQKDDGPVLKQVIKLEKLDSIHRRQVAMSILPQQYEDII